MEAIAAERRKREVRGEEVRRRQEKQLASLREAIEREKQQRAQSEAEMLTSIEELCGRVRAEVRLRLPPETAKQPTVVKHTITPNQERPIAFPCLLRSLRSSGVTARRPRRCCCSYWSRVQEGQCRRPGAESDTPSNNVAGG